jgi:hypothetical protein
MSISIGEHTFDGPFTPTNDLKNSSGVYVVLDHRQEGYYVVDVGESSEVKTRIEGHDRKPCWQKNATGNLAVAVHYTPSLQQSGRIEIEQKLRKQYNPTCGEQ